ncbi:dihydrolipoyllysine-residue succinyltransferase [Mariniblastus sp.]|nr:dihydrolipoyllysine-residue succinyltransferase [Mariniblastus sp.]
MFELKVPEFGESIQEVQVATWLKQPGDTVSRNEELVELESEKASQTLEADQDGVLQEIRVPAGEFAQVGDVLCVLAPVGAAQPVAAASEASAGGAAAEPAAAPAASSPAASNDDGGQSAGMVMPAAERLLAEYQISAGVVSPTGPGGRLLKEDVQNYIQMHGLQPGGAAGASPASQAVGFDADSDSFAPQANAEAVAPGPVNSTLPKPDAVPAPSAPEPRVAQQPAQAAKPQPAASKSAGDSSSDVWGSSGLEHPEREEKVQPMSMIRRTIASRLVEAQQTAALLTTFNEINMQPVKELRGKYKEAFLNKHGVKLGFMSFFAKAAVEGLKRFPAINSEVREKNVVMKNYHDIGIAIGGGKGLVVPVLRNVERLSFADVERTIGRFAGLARDNKIKPDDLKGGTFTISNGGVYGSLLSTPIVNPPQSGILGLHTIQDRPVAENGEVVIRPMMYIALTYDHRIVDGREAVGFLKTIKEVLEEPARLFLEV